MFKGSSIKGKLFSLSPWTEIDELVGGRSGECSELKRDVGFYVQSVGRSRSQTIGALLCPHFKKTEIQSTSCQSVSSHERQSCVWCYRNGRRIIGWCSFRPCPVRNGPVLRCEVLQRLGGAAELPPASSAAPPDSSSPLPVLTSLEELGKKKINHIRITHYFKLYTYINKRTRV